MSSNSSSSSRLKRVAIWWAGWFFIILGVLGLFLPILQGIIFLLIGLTLLSSSSPWAARVLHRLATRFPKISSSLEQAKEKSANIGTRIAGYFSGAKRRQQRRPPRIESE
ncbi:MAG TPA: PGPGW domain-containing protein [Blastocatellia bacterium]|nr:PGPGW domain-containing protein [Blastocatellia bacterium]